MKNKPVLLLTLFIATLALILAAWGRDPASLVAVLAVEADDAPAAATMPAAPATQLQPDHHPAADMDALDGAAQAEPTTLTSAATLTETAHQAYLPISFYKFTDYPAPHDTGFNCRYGIAAWMQLHVKPLAEFHAGWFLTFNTRSPQAHWNVEYVPVVRIKQDRDGAGYRLPTVSVTPPLTDDGLGALVDNQPGALWFVGNEPDRVYWQDDTMPDAYARVYHDIYHFIKQRDPTAQVGIAGLVQVTPGRMQYLDIVWETYLNTYGTTIPVDVWNMHLYILPEMKIDGSGSRAAVALGTDPALAILENHTGTPDQCPRDDVYCYAEHDNMDIFRQQVLWMRAWMKEHGQQHKPLVLSEFSTLYPYEIDNPNDPSQCFLKDENGECFTPERVSRFMEDTFAYLETATDPELGYPLDGNRLIQQWLWFAMDEGVAGSSNRLIDAQTQQMTAVGQNFSQAVAAIPRYVNLLSAQTINRVVASPTGSPVPEIGVLLRNNGNLDLTDTDFTVTFYADPGLTVPIGSVVVPAISGCARRAQLASVPWSEAEPGVQYYWYKIDALNQVTERDETDNVGAGMVIVQPQQLFLPVAVR